MSLQLRLLITLVPLFIAGLVAADVGTHAALQSYLLDVQPGFENGDPSQGFYNRVWILGNRDAVSTGVQAKIDQLTELVPVDQPTGK